MSLRVSNSELAKIAIGLGCIADVGGYMIWEIKHRYNLSERSAGRLYNSLMSSGLVSMMPEDYTPLGELQKWRFVLCDGITEEML